MAPSLGRTLLRGLSASVALLALGSLTGSTACSFIVETNSDQCNSDTDCAALGASFEGTFCNLERHVCAPNASFCRTNAECLDRLGRASRCEQVSHTCLSLLSTQCNGLRTGSPDDLRNDDVVVIGQNQLPGFDAVLESTEKVMEIVRKDFHDVGLPPVAPGRPRRPVVFVSCDLPTADVSLDQIGPTTEHLIDNAGAVAIMGPIPNRWATILASKVTVPRKVVTFLNSNDTTLESLPGRKDYLFRTVPKSAVESKALGSLVPQVIEPAVRKKYDKIPPLSTSNKSGDLKLNIVKISNPWADSFSLSAFDNVKLNGKTAGQNGDNYKNVECFDGNEDQLAAAASQVLQNEPHVIVGIGFNRFAGNLMATVEREWKNTNYRPFYYVTAGIQSGGDLKALMAQRPDLKERVISMSPGPSKDDPDFQKLQFRYRGFFPTEGDPSSYVLARYYDAAMITMYAIAGAAGTNKKLVGEPTLSEVIHTRLSSGTPIKASSDTIKQALNVIESGGSFTYVGVSGPLVFDEQGDVTGDMLVNCYPNSATRLDPVETGMKYNATANTLEGAFACPSE